MLWPSLSKLKMLWPSGMVLRHATHGKLVQALHFFLNPPYRYGASMPPLLKSYRNECNRSIYTIVALDQQIQYFSDSVRT